MNSSRRKFVKLMSLMGGATLAGQLLTTHGLAKDIRLGQNTGKTILFQGDSITEGGRDNTNWNHYFGQDYAYIITSSVSYDHPTLDLNFYNRGISSNRVRDLAARWDTDTLAIKPDILSILVGVNDAYWVVENGTKDTVEAFENEYNELLERTIAALPDIKLVLCEPFILDVGMVKKKPDWITEIQRRQVVVKKLAEKYNAIFIPLQAKFNEAVSKAPADHWIWDGIHPKPAGHELIAREWIKAVNKQLNIF